MRGTTKEETERARERATVKTEKGCMFEVEVEEGEEGGVRECSFRKEREGL